MVDFKKRLETSTSTDKVSNPVDIYETLDRASDKGPLRPVQVEILNEWQRSYRDKTDVILKLNTGQGKTLIGLLILLAKMKENQGASLYLCPNNFLVNQTLMQASQFGVPCVPSSGDIPAEFLDRKAILVAPVQKLFNGLSKFRIRASSLPVANIVIDDAHTCIDSIKDAFTIKLLSKHPAYYALRDLFSFALEEQGAGTYADIMRSDAGAFLPVPYWEWYDRSQEVTRIIARYADADEIKFIWPLLKDNLKDCLCVVSGKEMHISPYSPPLHVFGSYAKASHRVYMSATMTDDSFLIKGLGLSEDTVTRPLLSPSETWSGEKMVLMPSLIDSSLDESTIVAEYAKEVNTRKVGVVVLTPSFESTRSWKAAGAEVADKADIEAKVTSLKNGLCAKTLVVVNRYDGIDLPDNSCRLLVLHGKPFSEELLDRYFEYCNEGSELIAAKTARTIEQGLGRSVRGEKDYCVVMLIGSDLIRCVQTRDARQYFSQQTRAQIEIGLEIANLAKEDTGDNFIPQRVLRELITQCLRRDNGWKEYYTERMNASERQSRNSPILKIYSAEMKAELKYNEGNYHQAAQLLQAALDSYAPSLVVRGWYLQQMARYIYPLSKNQSNQWQLAAHKTNRYLLKPRTGMIVTKIPSVSQKRIANIIEWIKDFGTYDELLLVLNDILANLQFGVRAESFEKAVNDLAMALGFAGQRPDKEWKAGPDNLWALRDNDYLLIECKSEVNLTRAEITRDETGQMNNSAAWFDQIYPGVRVKRIMIIPTKKLSSGAGFNSPVQIMRDAELKKLVHNVRTFFDEFRGLDFSDLAPDKVNDLLNMHKLSVASLNSDYSVEPHS